MYDYYRHYNHRQSNRIGHPELATAPVGDFVALAEVKRHLRIPDATTDDDTLLTELTGAAVGYVDGWRGACGRCFKQQVWRTYHAGWGIRCYDSPFPEVASAALKYFDVDGVEQTVDSANYQIVGETLYLNTDYVAPVLETGRRAPVSIEWTVGFTDVPDDVKLAIKMLVAHFYENREAVVPNERRVEYDQMPLGVRTIIARYDTGFAV